MAAEGPFLATLQCCSELAHIFTLRSGFFAPSFPALEQVVSPEAVFLVTHFVGRRRRKKINL